MLVAADTEATPPPPVAFAVSVCPEIVSSAPPDVTAGTLSSELVGFP